MARVTVISLLALGAAAAPHPYAGLSRLPRDPGALRLAAARASAPPPLLTAPRAAWCAPGQPCWPTPAQWAALNKTVNGALIAVAPPLAPCFPYSGAQPDGPACSAAIANFSNSYWRASQPGASQEPNWEQDLVSGADCFDAAKPCELGNIPPYAVATQSAGDVAAALRFAASHSLRVVVKSSGHEYQGRSAGADALLVWVHALRDLALPESFAACPGDAPAPALTAAPGVSWGEAYAAADARRVVVVGGSEISVSACGGYTMGGGHSWMGPAYGMAADNVLQFEVVLANGTVVNASACEHSDLFWALRGGGGGTFGVVTQCTYKTHPFPAAGAAGAIVEVELLQGQTSLVVLLDGFLAWASALNAPGASPVVAGGYFTPNNCGTLVCFELTLGFNGTVDQANAAIAPLKDWAATVPQYLAVASAEVVPFVSLMAFHESFDNSSEATGGALTLGSRLIPAAVLANGTARVQVAATLAAITYAVGGLTGMLVTGGAVAANDPLSAATSLTPAWRRAGVHVALGAGWALNATQADIQGTFTAVSELTGALRNATPGSGAYWSESDYLEPEWQDAFWGPNYARLQSIKKAVDPTWLFTCHHCAEPSQ